MPNVMVSLSMNNQYYGKSFSRYATTAYEKNFGSLDRSIAKIKYQKARLFHIEGYPRFPSMQLASLWKYQDLTLYPAQQEDSITSMMSWLEAIPWLSVYVTWLLSSKKWWNALRESAVHLKSKILGSGKTKNSGPLAAGNTWQSWRHSSLKRVQLQSLAGAATTSLTLGQYIDNSLSLCKRVKKKVTVWTLA